RAKPPPRNPRVVLAGADEALSALASLRGPEPCKVHCDALAPLFAKSVGSLEPEDAALHATASVVLLALDAVSVACGAPMAPQGFAPERWIADRAWKAILPRGHAVALGLLAIGTPSAGRLPVILAADPVRFEPGAAYDADPAALALYLAGAVEAGVGPEAVAP